MVEIFKKFEDFKKAVLSLNKEIAEERLNKDAKVKSEKEIIAEKIYEDIMTSVFALSEIFDIFNQVAEENEKKSSGIFRNPFFNNSPASEYDFSRIPDLIVCLFASMYTDTYALGNICNEVLN